MKSARRLGVLLLVLMAAGLAQGAVYASDEDPPGNTRQVNVMTRNLYLGADLTPVIAAGTAEELLSAVAANFTTVQATNFTERAEALADEVAVTALDLIGLQEAVLYRTQTPANGPATPATDVALDFLQILLDAFDARNLHYTPVVIATGYDLEMPGLFSSGFMDIRLTQREVILARSDLAPDDLMLSNPQSSQFDARITIPTAAGPIELPWSWASIDARVRGKQFRLVTTHLDPFLEDIRVAQAKELLERPGDTSLPTIFIGDFNSDPGASGTTAYSTLISAGFQDSWDIAQPEEAGYTCCQAADLLNDTSNLDRRIDLILLRGGVGVLEADILGEDQAAKTPSGLWPSDHAGVAATLQLPLCAEAQTGSYSSATPPCEQ